jgi:hypothetical protein
MSQSYVRSDDGATMVEVEPHQYVNAKILRLQGRLTDGQKDGETTAASARRSGALGPSMSEVNQEELVAGRTALERWQTPAAFIAKVEELGERVKSDKLFNLTTVKFLLDAMVLAEFVMFRPTENVRLVEQKERWPDGQTGTPQNPIDIEITEVLEDGRRRGDEYRNHQQPRDGTAEDWRKRALAIPEQLEKAIKRKISKGYARKCVLVIYLNMGNYGLLQKEVEAAIGKIKAKYADDFHEVCILWQGKLL